LPTVDHDCKALTDAAINTDILCQYLGTYTPARHTHVRASTAASTAVTPLTAHGTMSCNSTTRPYNNIQKSIRPPQASLEHMLLRLEDIQSWATLLRSVAYGSGVCSGCYGSISLRDLTLPDQFSKNMPLSPHNSRSMRLAASSWLSMY